MTNSAYEEVLFEENGAIGHIILNRPKALNALTADMCVAIKDQLSRWQNKASVLAVVVTGAGEKAFCAGGDVVKVSKSYKDGGDDWQRFFFEEYRMNVAIDRFTKPYISFVDGITMGGGVGVSIPGDYWVASEKTLFAMPETGLGLFPDVGGGYFLPRLPGASGMYLALTGARLKAPDLYALGLASHVVTSDKVSACIEALAGMHHSDDVAGILTNYHSDPEPAPIAVVMDQIDEHFDGVTLQDILQSLTNSNDEWAQKQYGLLMTKSPLSLKVTFEQLKRGAAMDSFADNMAMEYRIVNHIMVSGDFHEGVRAILIDKDQKPVWSPASLDAINDDTVLAHFQPLQADKELLQYC